MKKFSVTDTIPLDLKFFDAIRGNVNHEILNSITGLDRYRFPRTSGPSMDQKSYVFITRPCLNLSSTNLWFDRALQPLNTFEKNSSAFYIRCILDTEFCRKNMKDIYDSPFMKNQLFSAFNIPLSNNLVGVSGWPDFSVELETTEGGFFSENQAYVIGSDRLYRTYNFQLTFKDIPGSMLLSMFHFWLHYMAAVTIDDARPYKKFLDGRRLDYTVAIYQFNVDPSGSYITKWAKATGCVPFSIPFGEAFSFNDNAVINTDLMTFSIPFTVNNVKYNDYVRIIEFNRLVKRYAPGIEYAPVIEDDLSDTMNQNYNGLPLIIATPNGFKLTWRNYLNTQMDNTITPEKLSIYINRMEGQPASDVPSMRKVHTKSDFIKEVNQMETVGSLYEQIREFSPTGTGSKDSSDPVSKLKSSVESLISPTPNSKTTVKPYGSNDANVANSNKVPNLDTSKKVTPPSSANVSTVSTKPLTPARDTNGRLLNLDGVK